MKLPNPCAALSMILLLSLAGFSRQVPQPPDEQLLKKAKAIHERYGLDVEIARRGQSVELP